MKILGISHGRVRFNDLPKPQIIYPDDILVKIQYALLPPDDLELYLGGNMIIPNPYMFGQAGSGIIEELGPAAYRKGLSEGNRVVWFYRANCGMCYQCSTGRPLYCPNMTYCTTSFAEYMNLEGGLYLQNSGFSAAGTGRLFPGRSGLPARIP